MSTTVTEVTNLNDYYDEKDPEISDQAREILLNYSRVAPESLISHVRSIRDRAWEVYKYPCVGGYFFLDLSISKSEHYPEALKRLKGGDSMLDLGCCFGQDIRKAVFDGAPPSNVFGSELEQGFLDLGYELFQDGDKLANNFSSGDFFSDDCAGLAGKTYDMIHAASFFHLFSWDEQVDVMTRTVQLLKPTRGSMIFGRQTAVAKATELAHSASRSGTLYRHDIDSFRKLVDQVARTTGRELDVTVKPTEDAEKLTAEFGWHRVSFRIMML